MKEYCQHMKFHSCMIYLYMDITRWSTPKWDCLYSLEPKMEKLYTVTKKRPEADCGSDHELLIAQFRLKLKKVGKTTRPFSSVQFSHSVVSDSLWPHEPQHTRHPCPSPTHGVYATLVHWVGDAIQPSHPLSSPSPPALNLSQHQGLFKWVSSSHQVAKVLRVSAST